MAIGDFLGKLKGEKSEIPCFLALELSDEVVQAAVWQVEAGKTELLTIGVPVEWDGDDQSLTELVSAADSTVSSAQEGLAKEPDQVIFGIESSWVESGKIIASKLNLIKLICKELELKPLGFVEIVDSVIRYLKMQEGTPASSLMIQVMNTDIHLSLVKLGKIEAKQTVGRSDDILSDVEEGISGLAKTGNLPSRILVFNSMHGLDDLVQNLTGYDWQKHFQFLHVPRVEALPKDIVIRSVALAGGTEVAKSIGFDIAEVVEVPEENTLPPSKIPEATISEEEEPSFAQAQDFGFGVASEENTEKPVRKPPQLPKISWQIPKLNLHLPAQPFLLLGLGLLLLIVGYFSFLWFVPKTQVTVYVKEKSLNESVNLTLSEQATSPELTSGTVPATSLTHSVSGEESLETTGVKTIGDPARGEVTIYNRTSLTKTFNADTVLTANTLKFTLDQSVTVASKSAGSDYIDVPGKATVSVTARAIGEAGNLAAGSEFIIASFSKDTYVGKNDQAFKGGSSKEIRVASATDKDNLVKSLTTKLAKQAEAELLSSNEPGTGIFVLTDSTKIESQEFNVKVGDEANSLIGSVTITLSALKYRLEDVENLVSEEIGRAIPPGFQRTLASPIVEITEATSEGQGFVEAKAKVTVNLLPLVDIEENVNSLRSLPLEEREGKFSTIDGYLRSEVIFSPGWLPLRLRSFPRNPENISLKVVSD